MKVMFYISTIREGGAARVMTTLANEFVSSELQDIEKVIFVTNFKTDTDYILDSKVSHYVIEPLESKENFLKKNINRVKKLVHYILMEKPDILISFMTENDARALVASKITKTKVILSVRSDPRKLFASNMKKLLARIIYGNADGVVFQTGEAQQWFSSKVQKKSAVIYNPIDLRFFDTVRAPKENLIVSCGRLTECKNYVMLINAIEKLVHRVPDITLKIYGDGSLKKELELQIKNLGLEKNVFLMGATNNVVEVLQKAELFVLSSDYEGMPNALMEAMAAGIPSVSTDCPCGGPKILFNGEFDELLIKCGDDDKMADVLYDLLEDDTRRLQVGIDMKGRATEFMPNVIALKWKQYIESVLK